MRKRGKTSTKAIDRGGAGAGAANGAAAAMVLDLRSPEKVAFFDLTDSPSPSPKAKGRPAKRQRLREGVGSGGMGSTSGVATNAATASSDGTH